MASLQVQQFVVIYRPLWRLAMRFGSRNKILAMHASKHYAISQCRLMVPGRCRFFWCVACQRRSSRLSCSPALRTQTAHASSRRQCTLCCSPQPRPRLSTCARSLLTQHSRCRSFKAGMTPILVRVKSLLLVTKVIITSSPLHQHDTSSWPAGRQLCRLHGRGLSPVMQIHGTALRRGRHRLSIQHDQESFHDHVDFQGPDSISG